MNVPIAANDNEAARLVTKVKAARYCGVTSVTYGKWILAGIMPTAVSITGKYDMRAIDAALDKLSGIKSTDEPEDNFDTWKRERNAKTPSRH